MSILIDLPESLPAAPVHEVVRDVIDTVLPEESIAVDDIQHVEFATDHIGIVFGTVKLHQRYPHGMQVAVTDIMRKQLIDWSHRMGLTATCWLLKTVVYPSCHIEATTFLRNSRGHKTLHQEAFGCTAGGYRKATVDIPLTGLID